MTTNTIERPDRATVQELPALTAGDRIALAVGTRLILRTDRRSAQRAARADRAEHARIARAAADADAKHRDTFEHRAYAGPTW